MPAGHLLRTALCLGLLLCGLTVPAVPLPGNVVDLTGVRGDSGTVLAQYHARLRARTAALDAYHRELIRRKIVAPNSVMPRLDSVLRTAPVPRTLARTRSRAENTLAFAYTGWSETEHAALSQFLDAALPRLISVYGPPLQSGTLTLARAGYYENTEGGDFNPATMTLTLEPLPEDFAGDDTTFYRYNLLHLVLHAFHAPVLVGFDAWEEGMARAAAAVAMLQLFPEFPLVNDTGYLLPLYDSFNQSALANATIFPTTGIPYLILYRLGMAQAAWLKLYGENPDVFVLFNQTYGQAVAANTAIAADLTVLKNLLANAVPNVEGSAFAEWFPRQYSLQMNSLVGRHLLVFSAPLHSSAMLTLFAFSTDAAGNETPVTGTAALEYQGFDYVPLYVEEGNSVTINASGDYPGLGTISPSFYNIGDPPTQRIRIQISLDELRATVYYPYWTRGSDEDESDLFGVTTGADDGTLVVVGPGIATTLTITQGAFTYQVAGGELTYFGQVRFDYTDGEGKSVTMKRNVGPGFYMPVLPVGSSTAVTLRRTFPAGLALLSFPLTPNESDAGVLFNYGPNSLTFKLAWWDPELTGDHYRRYPAIAAITPGRGYWMQLPVQTTVDIAGHTVATEDVHALTLAPGWNMIGNMYNASIDPWTMLVQSGSASYTLRDAMRKGIVGPVWTCTQGQYGVKNTLNAWEGAWLANHTGGYLTLVQPATRGGRGADVDPMRLLTDGGWGITLQARAIGSSDAMALCGVAAGALPGVDGLDWQKPPAFARGVRLAFVNPGRVQDGARYATDIRGTMGAAGESWTFEVSAPDSGDVTLTWPNLRAVPAGYQVMLEDTATGTRQYMRTTAGYTYQARPNGDVPDVRRFRLVVEPKHDIPVRIMEMRVVQTRGNGVSVQVLASGTATLTLEVRTLTGKLVRTIAVPPSRANESVVIPWDGRGLNGKLAPSGAYMLFLTARTAEGFTIRRAQPVVVRE
jgi:hypothetical protein